MELIVELKKEFSFYKGDSSFYERIIEEVKNDVDNNDLYKRAREEIIILMRLDWQDNKRDWFIDWVQVMSLNVGIKKVNTIAISYIRNVLIRYGIPTNDATILYLLRKSPNFYSMINIYEKEDLNHCKNRDLAYFIRRCITLKKGINPISFKEDNMSYLYQDLQARNQVSLERYIALLNMYLCKKSGNDEGYIYYRNSIVAGYGLLFKKATKTFLNYGYSSGDLIQESAIALMRYLDKYDGENPSEYFKFVFYVIIRRLYIFTRKNNPFISLDELEEKKSFDREWFRRSCEVGLEESFCEDIDVFSLIRDADLSARRRDLLELNFGLNGKTAMSMTDIATMRGLTKSRVSQEIIVALKKLKETWDITEMIDDTRDLSLCTILDCTILEKQTLFVGIFSEKKRAEILISVFGPELNGMADTSSLNESDLIAYYKLIKELRHLIVVMRTCQGKSLKESLLCNDEEYSYVLAYLKPLAWGNNILSLVHGAHFGFPADFRDLDFHQKRMYLKYYCALYDFLVGLRKTEQNKDNYLKAAILFRSKRN